MRAARLRRAALCHALWCLLCIVLMFCAVIGFVASYQYENGMLLAACALAVPILFMLAAYNGGKAAKHMRLHDQHVRHH